MQLSKLGRITLLRFFVVVALISSFLAPPAFCQETEDSRIFISGFNAYQQQNYSSAIEKLDEVLRKYPTTPLRDMTLFWLARAHFNSGHLSDAARIMSQFVREYPGSPLKNTAEEKLLALAEQYDRGEKIPAAAPAAVSDKKPLTARKAEPEQQRLAAQQADLEQQGRKLTEQAEQERQAARRAEQERIAAEKAEQDRKAREAEAKRLAAVKAEQERIAAEKAEQERLAREAEKQKQLAAVKAEQERIRAEKTEQERLAKEAEKQRRLAAAKAEQERIAAEKVALEAEAARLAAARKAEERVAAERERAEKALLREKAITLYKSVIQKYPDTKAAAAAAAKLKELGVAVALPPQTAAAPQTVIVSGENAQVLQLEVAQFAGFEFNLPDVPQVQEVGRRIALPFAITNRGNGNDSFLLESGFPAGYNAGFAASTAPDQAIGQTPLLAPGETFKGLVTLTIPANSVDGLRITHPVKAASRFMGEATQSREIHLTASAALLRAVLKTDQTGPLPGDKLSYRIAVLNIGSTQAANVTLRLSYPPQLEPLDNAPSGFRQEAKVLVLDGLQLKSGESREFTLAFQLKDDSLAGQELLTRAELIDNRLKTSAAFVSNVANVKPLHGIKISSASERLMVIPGETVNVPFIVLNTGNVRDSYRIVSKVPDTLSASIFRDLNRDGIRQPAEPVISEIGPLEPKEEAVIVIEVKTARSAGDGAAENIQLSFTPQGKTDPAGSATTRLIFSRPVLQLAMSSHDGRLKPGEITSFDLTVTNRGSNLARIVELRSVWPELLELVASEPAGSSAAPGVILWKFKELGAGEMRKIRVSFKVKADTGVGTSIQVKNTLSYEDQQGNRY